MSETAPEQANETGTEQAPEAEPETFSREYVEELRKENAKYRTKANENSAAAKAAEDARIAAMSETERAIEEAKQAARSEAATTYGKRLARTEFDALAGRRNADFDTSQALEYVDLSKFLDENGEPDSKAIKAAVERLVPEAAGGAPGFDGGARTPAKAEDFNQVLRRAAGRA